MRILEVRFKNLNSLAGEWTIDLTHPSYASDGIFAITGPTGAGKTTILDAICLALYGRTPRLNKVTKSANEVMSRQTGECFAEVTFEASSGRYRCHWSQHRARKRPDGELQNPKHEIANADTGDIYESKLRGVADQIESATGMDFDRFTRSMLLAQGSFAAFLQASADDRAPILEQITGTEIYSQISIRVHERRGEEKEKLSLLQAETAGIVILEAEQEHQIMQSLEQKLQEEEKASAAVDETKAAIVWLKNIESLEQELTLLAHDESELNVEIEQFEPDRRRLDRAVQAAKLDGDYATLSAVRQQQRSDESTLRAQEASLPNIEAATRQQADLAVAAERHSIACRQTLEQAVPNLKKARLLDQQIVILQADLQEREEDCRKTATAIQTSQQELSNTKLKQVKVQDASDQVEMYFKNHAQDEWLVTGLSGVEEQFKSLLALQNSISTKERSHQVAVSKLNEAVGSLSACESQRNEYSELLVQATKRKQQGLSSLEKILRGRLLREYRTEKDTVQRELAFKQKIASLEEHRAKLEDGQPCPVCGSPDHPYAEGNTPSVGEDEDRLIALGELIGHAENQEAANQRLELAEAAARQMLSEVEHRVESTQALKAMHTKSVDELKIALQDACSEFVEYKLRLDNKLKDAGIDNVVDTEVSSLLEALQARLSHWKVQTAKRAEFEQQNANLRSEISRQQTMLDTLSQTHSEKLVRLTAAQSSLTERITERKAAFGDKCPDTEEQKLADALDKSVAEERAASERRHQMSAQLASAAENIATLSKRIDERKHELDTLESRLVAALGALEFPDEASFLSARLSSEQIEKLAAKNQALANRKTELSTKRKDRESRLSQERALNRTVQNLNELESIQIEQDQALKDTREVISGLKHRLTENAAAKTRILGKQAAIQAQMTEFRRWDTLHELIGSGDGKKFRNFAQGLTFEMMIGHANRQLQKMTDRYLLIRDSAQPLDLNVIDSFQAGEVRSTKNLSGGEGFIISLSLALGLSQMASQNVRVDSLFLDEGFGTLDEEALDTALETLSGLQQEGKLIGVISHVAALKDRISTQIHVTPRSGGKSQLSGPGCMPVVSQG